MWTAVHIKGKALVTRKEVAEKAGVSPAVVSRVLNDSGYVAEEKRKRVLKIVKGLGYSPNPVAVSLKNNRTKQILYYVKDLSNNYFREMYKGMAEYASRKDFIFILAGYMEPEDLGKLMVDGVLFPTEDQVRKSIIDSLTVPYVAAGHGAPDPDELKTVYTDTQKAIDIAWGHLLGLGHRRIAYVCPSRSHPDETRLERFLCISGLEPDSPYVLGPMEELDNLHDVNYFELGLLGARQFLERDSDATGIICFNDDMAIGMMSYLQKEGLRIPRDISIVGIDGLMEGKYMSPPLTSVCLEMNDHGKECARVLIGMIEGKENVVPRTIKPKLISRESTRAI